MLAKLIWLSRANRNIQSIFSYISEDNPRAAGRYVQSIVAACDKLKSFPQAGRVYSSRYRILVVRNHLVFYRYEARRNEVVVVAVIDSRRDIEVLFTDD